jgi:hypothetical protein
MTRRRRVHQQLDEEVEGEEEQAEDEEESAPEEVTAVKLEDGVSDASGNDPEAGFAAALVERPGGNIAREAAAKIEKAVVEPVRKFSTVAPKRKCSKDNDDVAEKG